MTNGFHSPAAKRRILVGKLFLVDLAGSERLKKSGSEGVRASEAKSVNLSLTSLGKCIYARADQTALHVPFRDSKLTRLLQESLGGNAKTSLVLNVAPSVAHISESLSSLLFGSRAMKVMTKAVVNEEEAYRQLSQTLQENLDMHDDRVHSLEAVVYSQEEQLAAAKRVVEEERARAAEARGEKQSLQQLHSRELAAQEAAWKARLAAAQKAADQRAAHLEDLHRSTMEETVAAHLAQREALTKALQKTRTYTERLEHDVRRLEEAVGRLERDRAAKAQAEETAEEASVQEKNAARKALSGWEQRAAELLQSLDASRQEVDSLKAAAKQEEAAKVEEERRRRDEFALAAGHKLVADSARHLASALAALDRRFLTPRAEL